jgi:hypothetical protein
MKQLNRTRILVVLSLGLLGWALCGAIMFVGMEIATIETTLIVHAIGAPVIFAAISWFYFTRLNYTSPVRTAALFTGTVVFMDFFLVALVIEQSFEMFQSLLGTWIPFALIFLSTYFTGMAIEAQSKRPRTV